MANTTKQKRIIAQKTDLELASSFLEQFKTNCRQEFIAELAIKTCKPHADGPLTYTFIGNIYGFTKQYVGQLVDRFFPQKEKNL